MKQLRELLSGEHRNTIGYSNELARQILVNPNLIETVIELLINESDVKIRSRVAHALMQISKKESKWLMAYKDQFLNKIAFIPQWEVREQIVKILSTFSLNKEDIEKAFRIYKDYLKDSHAFVRVYALQGFYNLTLSDSSLIPVVQAIISDQIHFDKASIQARGRKLLRLLEK